MGWKGSAVGAFFFFFAHGLKRMTCRWSFSFALSLSRSLSLYLLWEEIREENNYGFKSKLVFLCFGGKDGHLLASSEFVPLLM